MDSTWIWVMLTPSLTSRSLPMHRRATIVSRKFAMIRSLIASSAETYGRSLSYGAGSSMVRMT